MIEQIRLVVNGSGGVGKDTFCEMLRKYTRVYKCSIIDVVKEVMIGAGLSIEKNAKTRKQMYDIKQALEKRDIPYQCVKNELHNSQIEYEPVFWVDMREKEDIDRFAREYGAIKVLIKNDRVAPIISNPADSSVFENGYDYIIENNGTLENLQEEAYKFVKRIKQRM